jgi:hypothetical protein
MTQRITDSEQYLSLFNRSGTKNAKQAEALRYAVDNRKFEIELYWKRAAYFWTFVAIAFGGFFALKRTGTPNYEAAQLLSCLGFIFSFSWYLVNRGSKYWQRNWERHIELLEDAVIGPLHKTVAHPGIYNAWRLHEAYPFSVSRVNQSLSLFIIVLWFLLACQTLYRTYHDGTNDGFLFGAIISCITVGFTAFIYYISRRGRLRPITIDFCKRTYGDPRKDSGPC